MVNIPVHNQDFLRTVTLPCVMSSYGNISEEAESHPAIAERVVSRRPNRAERSKVYTGESTIDAVENGACTGNGRSPGSFAYYCIGIELCTARFCVLAHRSDVAWIVRESELIVGRHPAFDMLDCLEETRVVAECASNRAETANVLGMTPASVVTAAVCVRDERDAHCLPRSNYLTGLRLRIAMRSVEPFLMPAAASDSDSSRISNPRTFTTKSADAAPCGKKLASAASFTDATVDEAAASSR
jgi:hypothetical protein